MKTITRGTLAALTLLALAPLSAHAQNFTYSTASGGLIPDDNATGISSTITVTDSFAVNPFVSITITGLTHSWLGDLVITLSHNGTTVDILDRVRGDGNTLFGDNSNLSGNYTFVTIGGADFNAAAAAGDTNYVVPSNVNYATVPVGNTAPQGGVSSANGLFSDFNGQNVNGTWTLNIQDRSGDDTGSFTGWQFVANNAAVVPESGTIGLMLAGIGLVGVALRRKK